MSIPWFSRLLNILEQLLLRLDGYIIVKYIEYIISSTDSLNELVNSNDNHVHAIIVAFCEPLGLS